ncbi:MAG: tRNA (guanosine(37)-N1)-methyltransferase TrmD [Phycisphaeraceae bacterium JB051]
MRIDVLTLFPEMFTSVLGSSILKRAADPDLHARKEDGPTDPPVSYHVTDIRDFANDKHNKLDKPPYGGGPGMVMQCQPIYDAVMSVEALDSRPATRIHMTPQGRRLDQALVQELASHPRLLIIAGHYEGIDERVIQELAPMEISIGDYVLSGGELPAMTLIDSVVRLQKGVLGDETSADYESFSPGAEGLLDCPHYTRPPEWMGMKVPDILLSGNHGKIDAWRREQSLIRTKERRPDLLAKPVDDDQ